MTNKYYIETNGLPVTYLLPLALKEGNSKKPVYRMHKWWARRLGSIFRAILISSVLDPQKSEDDFISLFESDNDIGKGLRIFDPFFGGGTTLVEAQRLGFDISGCEINPIAWYLTRQELSYVSPEEIDETYNSIKSVVASKIRSLYVTSNIDGNLTDIVYTFWVYVYECPNCKFKIELHPHYQLYRNKRMKQQTVFCSSCHEINILPINVPTLYCREKGCGTATTINQGTISNSKIYCPNCGRSWPRKNLLGNDIPPEKNLFAIEYIHSESDGHLVTKFKRATEEDKRLYTTCSEQWSERIGTVNWMRPFLETKIPSMGRKDDRPINYGFLYYSQLFNERQLLALSYIAEAIVNLPQGRVKDIMLLALSDSLASNNLLCSYAFDYKKLTPLFGLHSYQIVTRPVENNFWGAHRGRGTFTNCVRKIRKAMASKRPRRAVTNSNKEIACKESEIHSDMPIQYIDFNRMDARLVNLPKNSIDLIVTDPPYYDNIQYGELSDFFYSWLRPLLKERFPSEMEPENCLHIVGSLTESESGNMNINDFSAGLYEIFTKCKYILKDNGLFVFTFHHKNHAAWQAVKESLLKCDFIVSNVIPVRSEGRGRFHGTPGNLRWDTVIICRKASLGLQPTLISQINIEETLSNWKRLLNGLEGEPTAVDWNSMIQALKVANEINKIYSE